MLYFKSTIYHYLSYIGHVCLSYLLFFWFIFLSFIFFLFLAFLLELLVYPSVGVSVIIFRQHHH